MNSPLKGPTQNASKEGATTPGVNGRKSSISQGQGGIGSGTQNRPGPRRRDTSDSFSGNPLATPSAFGRQGREDTPLATPPSSLLRRRTDFREGSGGSPFDKPRLDTGIDTGSAFNSWKRNVSGPMSAGVTGPSSPWAPSGPQSAGFGAFGNFSMDNAGPVPQTPGEKRLGFGSMRGESRFKGLMSKESSEDVSGRVKDKPHAGLERLSETENERQSHKLSEARKKPSLFEEEERIGSAALGGDEPSPPPRSYAGNLDHKRTHDEIGFSSFNTPSNLGVFRDIAGRRDTTPHDTPNFTEPAHEAMSPTNTNPYQSPDAEKSAEIDENGRRTTFSLKPQSSKHNLSTYDGDRSQTSSAGRNISGLGAIGGSVPWSAAPGGSTQHTRAPQGFGPGFSDPIFGPMADLGTPTSNAFARSKMGALFPTQTQESVRAGEGKGDQGASQESRRLFAAQPARGALDEFFGTSDSDTLAGDSLYGLGSTDSTTLIGSDLTQSAAPGISAQSQSGASSFFGRSPEPDSNAEPPPAQQRQMVMPDRMRWVYRDPNGDKQGPFSGLEMHDWYKAGFFSPELQVKKSEDVDYEPLAQLIRRIGNSREPFLVPQIGIPHGQPTAPGLLGGPAPTGGAPPSSNQPLFGNSFPSFGTTLTADQQNALERRKQEEQYLMARQKEHLAATQIYMKQQMQITPMPMHPQQLHHHSSAHSLHSQPSYGSITSPGGFQSTSQLPIPPPVPNAGFFDPSIRPGFAGQTAPGDAFSGAARETGLISNLDRLNLGPPVSSAYGSVAQQEGYGHQQQVANMLQDRARLQAQQGQWESQDKGDGRENLERLEQFRQLRAGQGEQERPRPPSGPIARPANFDAVGQQGDFIEQHQPPTQQLGNNQGWKEAPIDVPTFDQNQQSPEDIAPQPSTSPLPAPAAQRDRRYIAEVLAAESDSRSQTPIETPTAASVAPWAKESAEGSKGPSLKEIQEAEARTAAQREEIAAASRRQAAEQERILQAQLASQAPAPAPGLPSSASWATSSPVTTSGGPAPWAKPAAVGKSVTPAAPKQKTLAQIQKEEEARKNKAAAAAAAAASIANVTTASTTPGGKRYADLASKASPSVGGAWTTVGAGGKVKSPSTPTATTAAVAPTQRSSSGVNTTTATTAAAKPKVTAPTRNAGPTSVQTAHDELQKWMKNSLGKGLNAGVKGM